MTEKEGESMAAQDQKHPVGGLEETNVEDLDAYLRSKMRDFIELTKGLWFNSSSEPVVSQ